MRFCRFGDNRLGLVEGPNVRDVSAALDVLPAYRHPLPTYDVLIANLDRVAVSKSADLAGQPRGVARDEPFRTGVELQAAEIEKLRPEAGDRAGGRP